MPAVPTFEAAVVVAVLAAACWIYLVFARGGFWRARPDDRAMHEAMRAAERRGTIAAWPRVAVVIPARDEAETVGVTVASLLAQRYAGELSVVVVDDHSDDGTADVARRAAGELGQAERLTVLRAPPLPAGWTGKLWAVATGVAHVDALPEAPEYLLLTDADIRYRPDAVAALVFSAVECRLVLSSLMVHLRCESAAERALIPAFVYFFQMLYPFAWVADPKHRTAAAAGGCMLVRRDALGAAGGIAAIRTALIDDCALARRMKPVGPIALALADQVASLRAYPSLHDIRRMVVRSAYAQLKGSPWLLIGVVLAMSVLFIAPVVLTFGEGWARGIALATWALMAFSYVPILRRYRVGFGWALALPGIAATYLAFTIESAVQHWRGRGGLWKGRVQGTTAGTP